MGFKKLSASKKKVITAKTQAAVARMVKKFWAKARKVKGRAKHKKKTLRKLIRKYKRKALGFWKRLQSTARKFKTKKRGKKKGKKTGKKEGKKATSPIVRKLNTSVKKV